MTTSHTFTQSWNACCEEDGCMRKITGVDWYYHLCSHGIFTNYSWCVCTPLSLLWHSIVDFTFSDLHFPLSVLIAQYTSDSMIAVHDECACVTHRVWTKVTERERESKRERDFREGERESHTHTQTLTHTQREREGGRESERERWQGNVYRHSTHHTTILIWWC